MLKKILFSTALLFTLPVLIWAQNSCTDTSYKKRYISPHAILNNAHYIIAANDSSLVAGRITDSVTNEAAWYIAKLTPLADVQWAVKIRIPDKPTTNYPHLNNLVQLKNNGAVLMISQDADTVITLIKVNTAGDIAWAKNIKEPNGDTFFSTQMYSHENDIYITCASQVDGGPGAGKSNPSIVKLDSNGAIVWSQYYGKNYDCKFSVPVGMLANDDSLIVFGRMLTATCSNPTIGFPDRERTYFSMKVNRFNGRMGKSMSYTNPLDLGPTGTPGLITFSFTATKDGKLYFCSRFQGFYAGPNAGRTYKVPFLANLNTLPGILYNVVPPVSILYSKADVDAEGNTNILYSLNPGSNAQGQYLAKFAPDNSTIRQKYIATPVNTQSFNGGKHPFARKRNYISVLTNFKDNPGSYLQLTQLSNDEQNSACFGKDTSFIRQQPYIIIPYSSPFFDGDFDLSLTVNDAPVSSSPLTINKEDYCETVAVCQNISISGKDTVCSLNQSVIYKSHLNAACSKHIFWEIDSSAIQSLNIIDDTIVSIRFKKNGQAIFIHLLTPVHF